MYKKYWLTQVININKNLNCNYRWQWLVETIKQLKYNIWYMQYISYTYEYMNIYDNNSISHKTFSQKLSQSRL